MTLVVRVGLGVGVELERREEESSRAEGRALCPSTLIDLGELAGPYWAGRSLA